ncbi:MAG: hypothetical protein P3W96_000880 [Halomonas sp.]|nr:hypothetical protein [Halomonas sp.]MDM7480563.1 hypothetical protein [Halomonas sp.]
MTLLLDRRRLGVPITQDIFHHLIGTFLVGACTGALLFGLSASAFFPTLFALCNHTMVMFN